MRYASGVLYLLAHPNKTVAIDLDTITCTVFKLLEDMKYGSYVGEIGGCLLYRVSDGNQLTVWMLRDKEKGEWM